MSACIDPQLDLRINEVWHSYQNRAKDDLALVIEQGQNDGALPIEITPLNLSTGSFVNGASRLFLRTSILQHYNDTGIFDPRFISLSDAERYDLKLKSSSQPLHVLTYATHIKKECIDEETGEVVVSVEPASHSFQAYYELFHFSQFKLTPNAFSSSDFKNLVTAPNDIDGWISSMIDRFNIDFCISQNRELKVDIENGTIKMPHPDFFRERHAFYFVALSQIVKWFLLTTSLAIVHAIRKDTNSSVLDILGHLIVDSILGRLNIALPKILNQKVILGAIERQFSSQLAMRLILCCEPLCEYLMSFTDIGFKTRGSQSAMACQISDACHRDLACFSEKPPMLRVDAQMQESESTTFRL